MRRLHIARQVRQFGAGRWLRRHLGDGQPNPVWPQSGERIIGADNRRAVYAAFPALPTITPRRMLSAGDLVVVEASTAYCDGGVFQAVFVFEFRGTRIAKETAYWAAPFEPAAWRAAWVEPHASCRTADTSRPPGAPRGSNASTDDLGGGKIHPQQ